MNQTSSIDDLLAGTVGNTQQPKTPEHQDKVNEEIVAEVPRETSEDEYNLQEEPSGAESSPEKEPKVAEHDEYGNEVAKPKTYTQAEADEYANRIVRERLARLERNNPNLTQSEQKQVQQTAKQDFEYNENSDQSWQQQLEAFVENTVTKLGHKQAQQAQQYKEQQAQMEFEAKFQSGMKRFNDYVETVQDKPITDAMVMAARSMKDPAAFFYAASKRAPQDLERIARIADPYAQIAEIAKLEERMKQKPTTTKAPKPVSKTKEDMSIPHQTGKKELTIEQMIAQEDAKRQAKLNAKRGR